MDKIRDALRDLASSLRRLGKRIGLLKYPIQEIPGSVRKIERRALYAAEDARHGMKKVTRHMESLLFSMLIVLASVMMLGIGTDDLLNSLVALLLLVLIVIIYLQLKFQKGMLQQYVPSMEIVKVDKCQAYSDRVRTVNLYGAKEKLESIRKVRHVRIRYQVMNDSFTPVSIDSASLSIRLRKGGVITLPSTMSVLSVEPKRVSGTEVAFRLPREVDFDSISWVELELRGNCRNRVRVEPKLYVNILLRGKKPEEIFEPFSHFKKRPEIRGRKPEKHL